MFIHVKREETVLIPLIKYLLLTILFNLKSALLGLAASTLSVLQKTSAEFLSINKRPHPNFGPGTLMITTDESLVGSSSLRETVHEIVT